MMRIGLLVCVAGLWALPAAAQELELRPPTMTTRTAHDCSPQRLALCSPAQRHALQHDLQCDGCSVAPLARDSTATPARSSLRCALAEMPLGPLLPECTSLPVDGVPRM